MYDRQTESWWQQATGAGIAGAFAGEQLTFLPATIIAWAKFFSTYPAGLVLSRETGFNFWFSWAAFKPETRIYQP